MFRPLLNVSAEFSAEELETALITPNRTLDDVHIPLLKVCKLIIFLQRVSSMRNECILF